MKTKAGNRGLSPMIRFFVLCAVLLTTLTANAAITYVGKTEASPSGGGAVSSLTVDITLTGAQIGDFLLAQVAARGGSNTTISAPAGWTQLTLGTTGTVLRQAVYYRVRQSGDPDSAAFSFSPDARAVVGLVALRGVDASYLSTVVFTPNIKNFSSVWVDGLSVAPDFSDSLLVGLFATATTTTFTPPGGMTERVDVQTGGGGPNGATLAIATQYQTTAGASGMRTAEAGGSARNIGLLIALKPAAMQRADYHFDECAYTGAAGEVRDSYGSNHATARNSLNTGTPGQVQRMANYDNYSRWAETSIALANDWSISVWFKKPFVTGNSPFYALAALDGGGDLFGVDRDDSWRWFVYDPVSGNRSGTQRFNLLSDGWHHLTVVGRGNNTQLYIDGVYIERVTKKVTGTLKFLGTSYDDFNTANAQGFRAPLDEFMLWDHALNGTEIAAIYTNQLAGGNYDGTNRAAVNCSGFDHVRLTHDGSAIACSPESVTIQACANASCSSFFSGGVTGNLTAGGNTMAFSIPNGSTSVTANIHLPTDSAGADPQTVRLGVASVSPAPTNSADCDNGTTINTTTACDVSVSKAGFLFDVPNLTAGIASAAVDLRAVRSDNSNNCVPLFQNVTRTVSLWGGYQNPSSGSMSVQVNGSNIETTATPAYASNFALAFNASGMASLSSVRYDDVGAMRLSARYTGSTTNTPPDGGMIVTGTDTFVVKPYGFKLSGLTCAAGDKLSSAVGTFCVAGGTFTGTVEAVRFDAAAANNLGAATPNFGQESTAQTVTFVPAALVNPTVTAGGTLSNFTSSSTGSFTGTPNRATATMIWPNVGTITIKPTMDYLVAGDLTSAGISDSTAFAGNVGRFYPHHFTLASGNITAGCLAGGFTYMSQANLGITYSVEARNKNNDKTSNYLFAVPGGYANLGTVNLVAENADAGTDLGGRVSGLGTTTWAAGAYSVNVANATFSRGASPDGAFDSLVVGVKTADADASLAGTNMKATSSGDCTVAPDCDATQIGAAATRVRFGRLWLGNAYGSDRKALTVPYETQYWNGQNFVRNTLDNCMALTTANFGLGNQQGDLAVAPAYGTSNLSLNAFSNGVGSLNLTAPNKAGSVDIVVRLGASASMCPSWTPAYPAGIPFAATYLQGKWCGGDYDKDPVSRATFGIFGSSAKKGPIYIRENF